MQKILLILTLLFYITSFLICIIVKARSFSDYRITFFVNRVNEYFSIYNNDTYIM